MDSIIRCTLTYLYLDIFPAPPTPGIRGPRRFSGSPPRQPRTEPWLLVAFSLIVRIRRVATVYPTASFPAASKFCTTL